MSNYQHSKDLEGQVLTLIEAIVPSQEQATAAKSIFRRLFHEWSMGIDVGMTGTDSKACSSEPDDWEAKLVILSPGLMKKEKRKRIADWLLEHSKAIVRDGEQYTDDVFTGRFMR